MLAAKPECFGIGGARVTRFLCHKNGANPCLTPISLLKNHHGGGGTSFGENTRLCFLGTLAIGQNRVFFASKYQEKNGTCAKLMLQPQFPPTTHGRTQQNLVQTFGLAKVKIQKNQVIAHGSVVKAIKKILKKILPGKSLLGSLVFARYREPSKKKFFYWVLEPSKKKGFFY